MAAISALSEEEQSPLLIALYPNEYLSDKPERTVSVFSGTEEDRFLYDQDDPPELCHTAVPPLWLMSPQIPKTTTILHSQYALWPRPMDLLPVQRL